MTSVEHQLKSGLAHLRLTGTPFHRIGWDFPDDLAAAVAQVRADRAVRAVVLAGGPRVFSAGADIAVLDQLRDEPTARRWLTQQHRAITELHALPLPVVALVEGAAAGAGMNLALAADHIVATQNASFSQAFIGIGLATDMGSLFLLPRRVGEQRARELMYTGRTVAAAEAHALGLADTLVADGHDAVEVAEQVARGYARLPLEAFAAIKRGVAATRGATFEESLDVERELQLPVCASADFAEGTRAFLDKRDPDYRDRPVHA